VTVTIKFLSGPLTSMNRLVSDICRSLFVIGTFCIIVGLIVSSQSITNSLLYASGITISLGVVGWYMSISEDYPLPLPFWLLGWQKKSIEEFSDKELYNYYKWIQFYQTRPIKLLSSESQVDEVISHCENEMNSRHMF